MAITITNRTLFKENKTQVEIIAGTFSTTDTSGTITTSLTNILAHSFGLLPASNLAAAESLCLVAGSITVNGNTIVPTSKVLTVGRVGAAVTTGLKFSLRLEGY